MEIKRRFFVTRIRRRGFHSDTNWTLAAAGLVPAATLPGLILAKIPPLAIVSPVELDITFALTDDPAEGEEFELFYMVSDEGTFPSLGSARSRSWWSTFQHWQQAGTPGNTIRTDDHHLVDFFNTTPFNNMAIPGRGVAHVIHIAAGADNTVQHNTKIMGVGTWQEVLEQRVYGDDSWTFTTADEKNSEGLTMQEEMSWV